MPLLRRIPGFCDWTKMSGVNEIRSTFLKFFADNGHAIVPSSPLVPRNDPTLMFTNAGFAARHHPFFEMLGNFSFGDYFKDRAIELAWNLVTKEFGLSKDRLTATVYVDDDEAFNPWKKIAGISGS